MNVPPHQRARLQKEEQIRELFNRWAADGRAERMERQHRWITEQAIARMELGPSERILDIGCGEGWTCRLLSSHCPEAAIVGIDVSDEMIRLARRKSPEQGNALFTPGSAEEIPWAEGYFTRVICVESAYYWHSVEAAIREIFRVTAFGGRIYVVNSYHKENLHLHRLPEQLGVPLQLRSAVEWQELFEAFGFQKVEARLIPDETPIPPNFDSDLYFRSGDEKEQFQRAGVLLLAASKPQLPPPGPIEPLSEPFPVVR